MMDHTVPMITTTELTKRCESRSDANFSFWVEKQTRSRVWIGVRISTMEGDSVFYAIFPSFPQGWDKAGPAYVVMHYLRFLTTAKKLATDESLFNVFDRLK